MERIGLSRWRAAFLFLLISTRLLAQPANDECATATAIQKLPFTDFVNTRLATVGANDPRLSCAEGGGGKTVWYTLSPATDVFVSINTRGSSPNDYDTALGLFIGACDTLRELFCNDDIESGTARQSEIFFQLRAGVTYTIHVAEWNGGGPVGGVPTGGNLVFNVIETTPPPLFQGPASGSIAGGVSINTDDFADRPVTTLAEPLTRRAFSLRDVEIPPKSKPPIIAPTAPEGSNFFRDSATPPIISSAPVLQTNFSGIPDIGLLIPPDPHMAAGPNHLMGTVNHQFAIFEKSGARLKLINADEWFAAVLPGTFTCDPQIVYDHHARRWIMIWIECASAPASLLLSISDDDNPLGAWCNWRLPGDVNDTTATTLANDYPKLGVDADAIYVTSNMFDGPNFTHTQLRIIPKAPLLNNSCGPVSWTDFWDLRNPSAPSVPIFTSVPAVTFGTPGVEYLIDVDFTNLTGTFMNLWSLTDPVGTPSLTATTVPVTAFRSPPFTAGQLGGGAPGLDIGGRRNRNVVYQNGSLWTAHSIADPTGQFSRARYVRIDAATATAVEDAALGEDHFWYYYPAVQPDGNGNAVMAFTRSGTNEYASARYTGRRAVDPPGLMPSVLLKAGEDNYVKTFGGPRNRWGDYMGIARDPIDSSTVWMFAQYAAASVGPGANDDRWGTWFGSVTFTPLSGPQLLVDPPNVDFGVVEVGESAPPFPVSLINQGDTTVAVTFISGSDSVFALSNLPTLPLILEPFESATFSVAFAPASGGVISDTIRILSDDADNPSINVVVRGEGLFIAAAPFDVLYAATGSASTSPGSLIKLDPVTGAGTLVGATGLPGVAGLAINSRGEIFVTETNTGKLYRLDAVNGAARLVANTGLRFLQALAFDSNDILYGIDDARDLYVIDPENGQATRLGNTGDNFAGMAFDPTDGVLWVSTGDASPVVPDAIFTMDPATGAAVLVGTTGLLGGTPDIEFDKNGNLLGIKGSGRKPFNLIAIDKSTARGTMIGSTGFDGISGLAFRPSRPQGPHLSVIPSAIDFGKVLLGETSATRRINLTSIGADSLVIESITKLDSVFALGALPKLPLVLSPRASLSLEVTFSPMSAGIFSAIITVTSNDVNDSTKIITLQGDGRHPAPAGAALFAVNGATSTISQIDPVIGRILSTIPAAEPTFFGADGLAYDGRSLFFVNGLASNKVHEIDPAIGVRRNSFEAPSCGGLEALAHSGASLFGLCMSSNTIFEMNPENGAVLNSFTPGAALIDAITFAGNRGTLFAVSNARRIHEIDSFTGASLNSFPSPRNASILGLGYSNAMQRVFAGTAAGKIFVLHPDTGAILDSLLLSGSASALAGDEFISLPGVHLAVSADSVDFGSVLTGRSPAPKFISLRSIGTDTLIIASISDPGAPFAISGLPNLPVTIPPRGIARFQVSFAPIEPGIFNAAIDIRSTDDDAPLTSIQLAGESVAPPSPGTLFASTFDKLISVNPASGAGTFIGSSQFLGAIIDVEFGEDLTLFGAASGTNSRLLTFDLLTGAAAPLGASLFGQVHGLEFDSAGVLFGSLTTSGRAQLVTIDPQTGAIVSIGPTGFNNVGGLSFAPEGTLYGVTFEAAGGVSNLVKIDPATGRGAVVGPTGFSQVTALEFDPEGVLYGGLGDRDPSAGGIITVNPATGAGTFVGLTGFSAITGLAFVPKTSAGVTLSIPDSLVGRRGEIVDVPLYLQLNDNSLGALEASIKTTPSGDLSFIDFLPGPILRGPELQVSASSPDSVRLIFADTVANGITQDGLLAILRYSISVPTSAPGGDKVTVALELSDLSAADTRTRSLPVHGVAGMVTIMPAVSVEDKNAPELPETFTLFQNYPNPFNPGTTIKYGLPHQSRITLEIFDMLGRRVTILKDEIQPAGFYEVHYEAEGLASGVYFYQLKAGGTSFVQTGRMLLVK